ncbi:DNA replication/repair protein RecF [Candidatus Dependentiae bacterium]
MRINTLNIKNFRCFKSLRLNFETPISIIQGDNGAGKTSILEAIHYMCYMRSFRASSPRDLIHFDSDNFFVKAGFTAHGTESGKLEHEIQVGFSQNKKLVKLDKKHISSFKDLMDFYRVVTLVEDDLWLIKGGPDIRRAFLDNAILLVDHTFLGKLREFKKVLQQRNMLLQLDRVTQESYDLWTRQLWEKSREIQVMRNKIITVYQDCVNNALKAVFVGVSQKSQGKPQSKLGKSRDAQAKSKESAITVSFEYKPKKMGLKLDYDQFISQMGDLKQQEMRFRRSLFGAHLDDFLIKFKSKKSKVYASRGQQKLVVLLLKAAQLVNLSKERGQAVFLLDDFMTDFDEEKAELLVSYLVSLGGQLIFTSPSKLGFFDDLLLRMGASKIKLSY